MTRRQLLLTSAAAAVAPKPALNWRPASCVTQVRATKLGVTITLDASKFEAALLRMNEQIASFADVDSIRFEMLPAPSNKPLPR